MYIIESIVASILAMPLTGQFVEPVIHYPVVEVVSIQESVDGCSEVQCLLEILLGEDLDAIQN